MAEALTKRTILAYLAELAEELGPGTHQHMIIVVGGSLLALHDLRLTTADIDSVSRLEAELRQAADHIADRHDLERGRWLNDNAAIFVPTTLTTDLCDVRLAHPRLLVLGAPLKHVFLMKLSSPRTRDVDDLRVLWPACDFASPEEAAAMWHAAYPHEEADPYLADYIRDRVRP